MKNLFQRASSPWVRYSEYEYKKTGDGQFYITPAAEAKPEVYDPLKDVEQMVLDALNIGALQMNRKSGNEVRDDVMEFVSHYGLLGFLTALPTTPSFMDYEAVYLPKNHFIREESMPTQDYLTLFFPFEKLDIQKKGTQSQWDLTGDKAMMALALAMQDAPQAVSMSFQREYAERYDWLARQFKDLAFSFYSSFLYYNDYDVLDEMTRDLYQQGMAAFGGIAPTYHIALLDKPTIIWDFHSLLLCLQMMFSFMLTDTNSTLKACKHCNKIFAASRPNAEFCSPQCKNRYNVYKSRGKE